MASKVSKAGSSGGYIQESFQELRKVTWPTKQQAVKLTLLVLGFCLIATVVLGVIDFGLSQGYRALLLARPQQQPQVTLGDVKTVPATGGDVTKPTTTTTPAPTDTSTTPTTPTTTTTPSSTPTSAPVNP